MEAFGHVLTGLAALAWPAIAFFFLWRFAGPLTSVIESAKTRKVKLKVGESELTMEEAVVQQGRIIEDLQKAFVLEQPETGSSAPQPLPGEEALVQPVSILWVDDNPKNNAYEVSQLQSMGLAVTTALSTEEALDLMRNHKYDQVVSDMARIESGRSNRKAGIELTKRVREIDPDVPIYIYCDARGALALRNEALAEGATDITSSSTSLLRALTKYVR